MKALTVTRYKAVIEIGLDDLFTIYYALNAVVEQYDRIDPKVIERHKDVVEDTLIELTNMVVGITDDQGKFIPSQIA